MIKKTLFLFLAVCLFNLCFNLNLALSQDTEKNEIAKTVATLLYGWEESNINKTMSVISRDFQGKTLKGPEAIINYDEFKNKTEEKFNEWSQRYTNIKITGLNITSFNRQDNNINVSVEYIFNAFDIKEVKDISINESFKCLLRKEGNIWKILGLKRKY